jgi:four helix bundle protein
MRNFRELEIWKKSIQFVKLIYLSTDFFPKRELYGLTSQLRRAAVSIPSNIAEGSSRNSEKEFIRFLEITMGSSFEMETQLIIAKEINFLTDEKYSELHSDLEIIQKQINQLIKKIRYNQANSL